MAFEVPLSSTEQFISLSSHILTTKQEEYELHVSVFSRLLTWQSECPDPRLNFHVLLETDRQTPRTKFSNMGLGYYMPDEGFGFVQQFEDTDQEEISPDPLLDETFDLFRQYFTGETIAPPRARTLKELSNLALKTMFSQLAVMGYDELVEAKTCT